MLHVWLLAKIDRGAKQKAEPGLGFLDFWGAGFGFVDRDALNVGDIWGPNWMSVDKIRP